jgi:CubicO group peptidase (beta-lactamase class C family)
MVAALDVHRSVIAILTGLATLSVAAIAPAFAQRAAGAKNPMGYGGSFQTWAAENRVKGGIIVVDRGQRTVSQSSLGGADPASPVLLASLSKAITATCIAKLIEEGRLAWSTPLRVALAHYFKAYGPPSDARVLDVTIEQLVLHRAGFSSRPKDVLTTLTLRAFLEKNASSLFRVDDVTVAA